MNLVIASNIRHLNALYDALLVHRSKSVAQLMEDTEKMICANYPMQNHAELKFRFWESILWAESITMYDFNAGVFVWRDGIDAFEIKPQFQFIPVFLSLLHKTHFLSLSISLKEITTFLASIQTHIIQAGKPFSSYPAFLEDVSSEYLLFVNVPLHLWSRVQRMYLVHVLLMVSWTMLEFTDVAFIPQPKHADFSTSLQKFCHVAYIQFGKYYVPQVAKQSNTTGSSSSASLSSSSSENLEPRMLDSVNLLIDAANIKEVEPSSSASTNTTVRKEKVEEAVKRYYQHKDDRSENQTRRECENPNCDRCVRRRNRRFA